MHESTVIPGPREPFAGPLRCRARAFTLIELVIVMMIVAVVAAIAVPRYQLATARYRALGAARRIAADIEGLRQQAVARSLGHRFRFRNTTTYQLTDNTAGWAGATVKSVDLSLEPYRARVSSLDLGNDGELLFNGFGVPDGAATITIAAGVASAQVSVNASTGAVSARLVGYTSAPSLGAGGP